MSVRKQERQYCLQTLGQSSSKPVLPRELHLQRVPGCLAGTGYRLALLLRDTALLCPSCLRGPRSEMQQRPEQADHKHFWARRFVARWKTIVTRRCDIYTKKCTFRQLFLPQTASSYESTFSLLSDTALSVCSFVVWCQETYLHSVQRSLAIVVRFREGLIGVPLLLLAPKGPSVAQSVCVPKLKDSGRQPERKRKCDRNAAEIPIFDHFFLKRLRIAALVKLRSSMAGFRQLTFHLRCSVAPIPTFFIPTVA